MSSPSIAVIGLGYVGLPLALVLSRHYSDWDVSYEPIPPHPHNAVLQVWLEPGALIFLALLPAVVRAIQRSVEDRLDRTVALKAMTAERAIASINFGAWQSWWLTSIMLGGAFMASVLRPLAEDGEEENKTGPEIPGAPPATGSGPVVKEIGGPKGPEPTRYGNWEKKGRVIDF